MNSLGACSHKNSYLAPILYGDSRDRGFGESEGQGEKERHASLTRSGKGAGRKGTPCLIDAERKGGQGEKERHAH